MRRYLYYLAVIWCLVSCSVENNHEGVFAKLAPCHVESVLAFVGCEGEKSDPFCISVFTFDSIMDWDGDVLSFQTNFASAGAYCKEYIKEVDKYILDLVNEKNKGNKSKWDTPWGGSVYDNCYGYSYRLEGIIEFTITANMPIKGVGAGEEITQCFMIEEIDPKLVFSYDDYSPYTISGRNISICDWLNMKPLAPPYMLLRLKDCTLEAVNDIAFTITMKLTNGRVLTATTPIIGGM